MPPRSSGRPILIHRPLLRLSSTSAARCSSGQLRESGGRTASGHGAPLLRPAEGGTPVRPVTRSVASSMASMWPSSPPTNRSARGAPMDARRLLPRTCCSTSCCSRSAKELCRLHAVCRAWRSLTVDPLSQPAAGTPCARVIQQGEILPHRV